MNETSLPECEHHSVCNKVDVYDKPWIEKQCKCPQHTPACSISTHSNDGHTISDKTKLYKVRFFLQKPKLAEIKTCAS